MSTLNRLKELAGLKTLAEVSKPTLTTKLKPEPQLEASPDSLDLDSADKAAHSAEDSNKDGTVSPDESSKVQTASSDMAKAKLHVKNLQQLHETIRTDIKKYSEKVEAYVQAEFGGLTNLPEIDEKAGRMIISHFQKFQAIGHSKLS